MLDIWRSTEGSKYNKLYHYHLLNGSSLPITGTESSYQPMDGWFTEGDRITRDGTEYVLTIENNRAVKHSITTGDEFENGVAVLSGLEHGEEVIHDPTGIEEGAWVKNSSAEGDSHA